MKLVKGSVIEIISRGAIGEWSSGVDGSFPTDFVEFLAPAELGNSFKVTRSILKDLRQFMADEPKLERQETLYLVDIHRTLLMPLHWNLIDGGLSNEERLEALKGRRRRRWRRRRKMRRD